MAVSASGTQRQDQDFYRGAPASGKAVCRRHMPPQNTPCMWYARSSVEAHAQQAKRAGGGETRKTVQQPGPWRNADDSRDAGKGVHTTLPESVKEVKLE